MAIIVFVSKVKPSYTLMLKGILSQTRLIGSLETHKYVISIKGTDEIPEIHLVLKHPKLETLIGETLPKVWFKWY